MASHVRRRLGLLLEVEEGAEARVAGCLGLRHPCAEFRACLSSAVVELQEAGVRAIVYLTLDREKVQMGCISLKVLVFLCTLAACGNAERVMVTFFNATLNEQASVPDNVTVVKRYGRRLLLECPSPCDWLWLYFGYEAVADVESDLMTVSSALQSPWHLNDTEPYGLHIESLRARTNGSGVVVSVLDGGLPQVAQEVFRPAAGYSFVTMDPETRDLNFTDTGDCVQSKWHGTHVASVLNAIAPGATLIVLRVLDACGTGFASDIADAVVWAAGGRIDGLGTNAYPAQVISMSFAGRGPCPSYLQSAVSLASAAGSILFAAAGNAAQNADKYFPGNCIGVMTVGASTRKGTLAAYSNWGAQLSLSAPGGDREDPISVLTLRSGKLVEGTAIGTSLSVPHASGLYALLLGVGMSIQNASGGQSVLLTYFPSLLNGSAIGYPTANYSETMAQFGNQSVLSLSLGCPSGTFECYGVTCCMCYTCAMGEQAMGCSSTGTSGGWCSPCSALLPGQIWTNAGVT